MYKTNECKNVIEGLIEKKLYYHTYQPLYRLSSGSLFGYEALLRSDLRAPEQLFRMAAESDRLNELDAISFFNAILTFYLSKESQSGCFLFLNIFPSTLVTPSFSEGLEKIVSSNLIIPHGRLVLEINEGEQIEDMGLFQHAIAIMRQYGFLIAIDDVGKGMASLKNIIELEPDFIKLDRYFSINLSASKKKQRWIELIVEYCKDANVQLVLEGIEKLEDLATAKALGVSIGQGYLLGKPDILDNMIF